MPSEENRRCAADPLRPHHDHLVKQARSAAWRIVLRCIVIGKDLLVEPGAGNRPEVLPHLQLDDLLAELQARLQAVSPDVGLRLSEIHGLGEARQMAEDLIDW